MAVKRHPGKDSSRLLDSRLQRKRRPHKRARATTGKGRKLQFRWATAITPEQWRTYRNAIEAVRSASVPFMLGGGFALATYTGRWRDTKDIDLYIHPQDRERTIAALTRAGFRDYYDTLPYDRKWIYRSTKDDFIVDIIWAMANQRARVDQVWFERAATIVIREENLKVLPMEEFMWCKLYIMQRDHCDWTDLFNLLYANARQVNWDHLLQRIDEDTPLLRALLEVFGWLCPAACGRLPASLWRRLGMRQPRPPRGQFRRNHIPLLDSRGWFAALQPLGKKLEI
ncbi:MAG TPA: nucleotidyltransferase [Verrucomicrobiae bacterium]|nr:nucleotidyltransferase [Verrucomicrobiae bacterium]